MNAPLAILKVYQADRELFVDPAIDDWRGGNGDLFRMMRDVWRKAGAEKATVLEIHDWEIIRRTRLYAAPSYGAGTWQTHVRRWARQIPATLEDPQASLF